MVASSDPHWLVNNQAATTDPNVNDLGWSTFGWSHGYISFDTVVTTHEDYSWTAVTATALSLDGVSWAPGGSFTRSGGGDSDPFPDNGIVGIVEGAGSILAYTGTSSMCSWVSRFYAPIAVSGDGTTWTNVTRPFGSIQIIDGAGAGFIELGTDGVFTSVDGLQWTEAALTGKAFARLDLVQSGTVADDGFVISGVTFGPEGEGCGAGPALLNPTLWFSGDGKAWTKLALPGAIAGSDVRLDVCRAGRLLVADEQTGGKANTWVSSDGRTWTVSQEQYSCENTRDNLDFLRGGGREMFFQTGSDGPTATLSLVNDDLSESVLVQTGDVPDWSNVGSPVLGPAGVIASSGDGTLYFGVPVTQ